MPAEPSYAVVWRDPAERLCAGRADVRPHALSLRGRRHDGAVAVAVGYPTLATVRVGRSDDERLDGVPTLVLALRDGGVVLVASLADAGALIELADRVALHLDPAEAAAIPRADAL